MVNPKSIISALAALMFMAPALAQAPLRSFALQGRSVPCNQMSGGVSWDLMPLDGYGANFWPPAIKGSGPEPTGNFSIRKVAISHFVSGQATDAWALIGHSGNNGDWITPPVRGNNTLVMDFPADAPILFAVGDWLDVHAGCSGGNHYVEVVIWYLTP